MADGGRQLALRGALLAPLVFMASWIEPAAWAAYILGGLILLGGVVKLVAPDAGYIDFALLAAVLFLAPWLVGFTGIVGWRGRRGSGRWRSCSS